MSNQQYDETNRFALFPNQNMREDRNDPNFTGYINIDGKEYWLNAWTYEERDGSLRLINGSIGNEREQQRSGNSGGNRRQGNSGGNKSNNRGGGNRRGRG